MTLTKQFLLTIVKCTLERFGAAAEFRDELQRIFATHVKGNSDLLVLGLHFPECKSKEVYECAIGGILRKEIKPHLPLLVNYIRTVAKTDKATADAWLRIADTNISTLLPSFSTSNQETFLPLFQFAYHLLTEWPKETEPRYSLFENIVAQYVTCQQLEYWDDAELIMMTVIELFQNSEHPMADDARKQFNTIAGDFLASAPEEVVLRLLRSYTFAFLENEVFDLSKIGSRSLPAAKLIFVNFPKWRADTVAKLITRRSDLLPALAEDISGDSALAESIGSEILNNADHADFIYECLGRIRNRSKVLKTAIEKHFDSQISARDLNAFSELESILNYMEAASYKPTESQETILRKAKDSQPYDQLTDSQRQLLERFFGKRRKTGSKKPETSEERN